MPLKCANSCKVMYNCNICNKNHYKTFLNDIKLYTNKTIYNKLTKIPEEDKINVYEIKNFKFEILDITEKKFYDFSKITCFTNVERIDINIFYYNYIIEYDKKDKQFIKPLLKEQILSNEIAKLQHLAYISFTDNIRSFSLYKITKPVSYIYEDKMIIFLGKNYTETKLPDIPLNIKFLNILANNYCNFNNLPEHIEHLNLSFTYKIIKNLKLNNLSLFLKTLNIIFCNMSKTNDSEYEIVDEIIKQQCKIPFGCIFTYKIIDIKAKK
jgi:hypothetical protein